MSFPLHNNASCHKAGIHATAKGRTSYPVNTAASNSGKTCHIKSPFARHLPMALIPPNETSVDTLLLLGHHVPVGTLSHRSLLQGRWLQVTNPAMTTLWDHCAGSPVAS